MSCRRFGHRKGSCKLTLSHSISHISNSCSPSSVLDSMEDFIPVPAASVEVDSASGDRAASPDGLFVDKPMVSEGSFFAEEEEDEEPEERVPATSPSDGFLVQPRPVHPQPAPPPPSASPEFVPAFDYASSEEEFLSDSDSDTVPIYNVNASPLTVRPSCVNVFMPHVLLEHFDNLAFAHVYPPARSPAFFIRRALAPTPNHSVPLLRPSCGLRLPP